MNLAERCGTDAPETATNIPASMCVVIPVADDPADLESALNSVAGHSGDVHIVIGASGRAVPTPYARADVDDDEVALCAWAIRKLRKSGQSVLILKPGAQLTPGCLDEMAALIQLHERHAVVSPRSNRGALVSVPCLGGPLADQDSYDLWTKVSPLLPRYQVCPAINDSCVLISGEALDRFDFVELHDFVELIDKCGYSALIANRAFAFCHASASAMSEKFGGFLAFEADPVDLFAITYISPRPRVLFDLSHLSAQHSGTSEFALRLLRELARLVEGSWELSIRTGDHHSFFAGELQGYRSFQQTSANAALFDLVYRPSHIFSWPSFAGMNRLAPRLAFTLLDIITVRCGYLSRPELKMLLKRQSELADEVFTISDFSQSDFKAFYQTDAPMRVIHPGTMPGGVATGSAGYVLVMGNSYAHKGVVAAVEALGDEWPVVVLGDGNASFGSNVRSLGSGHLSRRHMYELLAGAAMIVYPSHYEGYGLPVVDSLAMGKAVVVLDTAVNRELADLTGDSNLHRIKSAGALRSTVQGLWESAVGGQRRPLRSWADAAAEYLVELEALLRRPVDVNRLRKRWEVVRLATSLVPQN